MAWRFRNAAGQGSDNYAGFHIGNALTGGAHTMIFLVRMEKNPVFDLTTNFRSLGGSYPTGPRVYQSGGPWFSQNDFTAGFTGSMALDGTAWCILGVGKTGSGSNVQRFHQAVGIGGTLTWTHSNESGNVNSEAAGTSFRFGAHPSEPAQASYAAIAYFNSFLSDLAVEGLGATSMAAWLAASPAAAWQFNVPLSATAILDLTGGGADQYQLVAGGADSSMGLVDDPPGWTYYSPPGPTMYYKNGSGILVPSTYTGKYNLGGTPITFGTSDLNADSTNTAVMTVELSSPGNFQPQVELAPGSLSVIQWIKKDGTILSTSATPTIALAAGIHEIRLFASIPADVYTLNLGFDHTQDAPDHGGLSASYDIPTQGVKTISNLGVLTGLKRFMCADTAAVGRAVLQGSLDLTGLANLTHVEVFGSDITSVNVTGCSSMDRLCVEQCKLPTLDITPVRLTLKDLRAAFQNSGAGLTIVAGASTYPNLWHFCVRDQIITGMPSIAQFPKLEQWWVWNCGLTTAAVPISPDLWSISAFQNAFTQTAVDNILVGCNTNSTKTGGFVELQDGAAPSATGLAAKAALEARSPAWTIQVHP